MVGGGENFMSKLKNGKNLKEDFRKKEGRGEKRRKKKRVMKHTLK